MNSTYPLDRQMARTNGGPGGLVWLVVLFSALVFALVMWAKANAHMVERHGTDAEAVVRCLNERGTMLMMTREEDGRKAHICQFPDGHFGVYIEEDSGQPVTAFIKEKMKRLEQVVNYLKNRGYR